VLEQDGVRLAEPRARPFDVRAVELPAPPQRLHLFAARRMLGGVRRFVAIATTLVLGLAVVTASAPSAPTAATVIKTAYNAELKKTIVVDGRGRTVYLLISDTAGVPTCAQLAPECPKAWPAVPANGKPLAGKGITAGLLGIATGAGGVKQVTYNHHPLYFFRGGFGAPPGDKRPGHVRGQAFYGIWYVLSAKGRAIK
jgi:predicted lipoprotein with Yx(FWY)xxD motif